MLFRNGVDSFEYNLFACLIYMFYEFNQNNKTYYCNNRVKSHFLLVEIVEKEQTKIDKRILHQVSLWKNKAFSEFIEFEADYALVDYEGNCANVHWAYMRHR